MSYKTKKHKSVMQHKFSEIPRADIQRSTFNRSHTHKSTFDSGLLIPIYIDEALPGDTFKMNTSIFARMATPIAPVMDNASMSIHFFGVPKRLLWVNFQKFMGEQDNPGDSTDFLVPQYGISLEWVENSIHDYMGVPKGYEGSVNAWWLRAYYLIWNEWYRDQNLQDSLPNNVDDGPDTTGYALQRRGKRHDYFTSCLPFPQKGPAVDLPLGESAPIVGSAEVVSNGEQAKFNAGGSSYDLIGRQSTGDLSIDQNLGSDTALLFGSETGLEMYPDGLTADLSNATAATINSLRMAFQLQKMYERDARGGTRYTEIINAHFNVTSPDARLQRPEFLGGGKIQLTINPVAQTAGAIDAVGTLAGVGTMAGSGIGFNKSFTEDMVIIGLACVTCDLTYQQGLNRMFSRRTRFDHYWPALAHLGEQEVLNKEIFADNSINDDLIFGYQERYAEYRYFPSRISGRMRSTSSVPLDVWHYSQEFDELPTLSAEFIEENPPIDRNIAVQSEPQFLLDCYFNLICDRPMPVYSVPGLIDHF